MLAETGNTERSIEPFWVRVLHTSSSLILLWNAGRNWTDGLKHAEIHWLQYRTLHRGKLWDYVQLKFPNSALWKIWSGATFWNRIGDSCMVPLELPANTTGTHLSSLQYTCSAVVAWWFNGRRFVRIFSVGTVLISWHCTGRACSWYLCVGQSANFAAHFDISGDTCSFSFVGSCRMWVLFLLMCLPCTRSTCTPVG